MRITIEIAAATAGFETDIKRASREADKALKQIEKQARVVGLAVAGGLAAAAVAVVALTKRSIDAADAMAKMSQKVGVSVEKLAGLQHAAKLSGVNIQQLQTGLTQLVRKASEAAAGTGEGAMAFTALGISATDANGKLKSTEQLLNEVSSKFASYEDGAAKSALATRVFGEAGVQLLPLLNQGAEGLAAMQAEAQALGLVISTETAQAAELFNDNMTRLTSGFAAFGNQVMAEVLPSLNRLTQELLDSDASSRLLEEGALAVGRAFRVLVGYSAVVVGAVKAIGTAIYGVYEIAREFTSGLLEMLGASLGTLQAYQSALLNLDFEGAFEALRTGPAHVAEAAAGTALRIRDAWQQTGDGLTGIISGVADVFVLLDDSMNKAGDGAAVAAPKVARMAAPIVRTGAAAKEAADEFAKLAKITDDLARELAGPMERAWLDYQDRLRGIADAAARAILAGEDVTAVQTEMTKAVGLATVTWEKHRDEIRKQFDPLERLHRLIDDEIARSVDSTAAVMTQMAAALEEATRQYGPHSEKVKEAKQRYDDLMASIGAASDALDQIRDKAIDTATNALQQTLGDAFAGLTNLDPWEALGQAVTRNMDSIVGSIQKAIDTSKDAVTGVIDWGMAFDKLGESAGQAIGEIAKFMGAAIGGGGEKAQIGAQLGSLFGPIGSIVGGFLGGLFDKDPRVQVAGSAGRIRGSVKAERETAFGNLRVKTDKVQTPTNDQIADAILNFDRIVSTFLTSDQIDAVTARLASFSLSLENGSVQMSIILEKRFDAILETLPPLFGEFINAFSQDLETQVQALSDILALDRLAQQDNLITSTLEQTLDLVNEFGRAGETIGQTYARLASVTETFTDVLDIMGQTTASTRDEIARMAAELGDAAGSTERATALLEGFYDAFYSELEQVTAQLEAARNDSVKEFADIGLDFADFQGEGSARAFRDMLEEMWPTLGAEARVQWLEAANAFGLVLDLTEQYNEALADTAESGEEIIDYFEDLQELLQGVEDQIAALEPEPGIEDRIAAVNTQIEDLIEKAIAFGASEEELNRIRYLGQLRLGVLLEEQAAVAEAAEQALRDQAAAAESLADYMAVLNAEATDGVSPLTAQLRTLRAEYDRHIERINELAIASGRSGASFAELGAAQRWYQAQVQRLVADLLEQASGLVAQFYGQTAGVTAGSDGGIFGAELGGIGDVTAAVEDRYARELALLKSLQEFIDSLLLSDLSPLTPDERLAEAQAQYEALLAAAQGGDLDALAQLQGAAQAYLGEAQSYFGGVGPYGDIFANVLAQLGALTGAGPINEPISPTVPQAVFGGPVTVEPGPGFEALSELDRQIIALELVEVLRDLIVATNSSLLEVADQLGLDLLDLVEALGINLNELTVETTLQLADLSRALGIDLVELATSVGVDLGSLADEQSLLNDALEQTIAELPVGIRERLNQLLRDVESAVTEADANAAIGLLEDAVGELPPELQALLAPFFENIVTPGDDLLAQAIAQTTELTNISNTAGWQLESLVRIEGLLVAIGAGTGLPGTGGETPPYEPWNPGDGPGTGPFGDMTVPDAITQGAPAANDTQAIPMQAATVRLLEEIAESNRRLLAEAQQPVFGGRRAG